MKRTARRVVVQRRPDGAVVIRLGSSVGGPFLALDPDELVPLIDMLMRYIDSSMHTARVHHAPVARWDGTGARPPGVPRGRATP